MKKFLGTMSLAFLTLFALAQNKVLVKGIITDKQSRVPLAGASISLGSIRIITDETGHFLFSRINPGSYRLVVSSIGYQGSVQDLQVKDAVTDLSIALEPAVLYLEPLEVKAVRASDKAPFAKTNLSKEEIGKNNLGQDIPFLLNQTPSVVVNADAGNGVGYTAMRIRGSDATRINVTLNGIPYNDAESMGTFFVNLPDFASSVSSIQVQRGVGTSSNGASAFGATLNLATNEYNEKPYAEFNNSFGSFNTWKNTVRAGSGLIDGHFTVDARLSKISSDGYIDRATSDLHSFYLSTAWMNKRSSLRFNLFSGKEKTYQAWYGVAEPLLHTDRTNNPAGTEKSGAPYDNQTDNYTQTHYQLFFNHAFSNTWSFNTAAFLTRGFGYYEEYKANAAFSKYGLPNVTIGGTTITSSDLVRQRWLDNYFYGQTFSLRHKNGGNELTFGGGWSRYDGTHFGTLPWIQLSNAPKDYRYYDYDAVKKDVNFYAKWQHQLGRYFTSFADVQYRNVNHTMNGFQGNPQLLVNRHFNFINPKAGITYARNGMQLYFSYALGNKEPNRDDFQASPVNQPKHETMHDFELGFEKKNSRYRFAADVYYMYYRNQLVLTGKINDVGANTRINVPYSYRLGLELQASAILSDHFNVAANIAFSRNKISSFTEYIDNFDTNGQDAIAHRNTNISYSPAVVGGLTLNVLPVQQLTLSLMSKWVGKQYMDNTQNENRKLNGFFVQDARLSWQVNTGLFRDCRVIAQVNNLFNKQYEPNGFTYNYISGGVAITENGYYPMAGTNFVFGLNIGL